MSITDRALTALRRVFGDERDEREKAESPSADALMHSPTSTYAIWGREDIGGLLSVSQNLMDRYADYEAMNDYPDIRCFTGDMKVYVVGENSVVTPMTIKDLAASGESYKILGYDDRTKTLVPVLAEHPRISGRNAPILRLELSNGEVLRVTPEHKIFCVEPRPGYVEAKELRKGAFIVGARAGFELHTKSLMTVKNAGGVWLKSDPIPEGFEPVVYDITTATHNLLVNGAVCHNSAFHYFANDATQPNMDNGRVCWVVSPDQAVVDMADTLIKRRLRLEDDLFSIAYTLCIGKGGRVWGDSLTEIQNAQVGEVVTGSDNGERADFTVKRRMDNGRAAVVRVKTAHREFYATPDHRVLTENDHGVRSWTRIKDFKCHRHPGGQRDASSTKIVMSTRSGPGRIKPWDELLQKNPFLQEWGNKGSPTQIQLPPTVEPWFCRLYGFLMGDGFLGGDYQVVYARDPKAEDINSHYDGLLRRLGVEPTLRQTDQGEYTVASSVQLNRLLSALGFTNGATKKRMPAWVFGLPEEHREEFLWGFIDADGWTSQPKTWTRPAFHFEIANYDLARDLKNLIDGLGFRSGNLRERTRKPGFKIKDVEVKTTSASYILTFSTHRYEQAFIAERVLSVEPAGEMEVYDIEVDNDAHNFVVDGVVVHNCQYGNDYEEVLVTDNGVVGLNNLAAPTMRRVEKLNGSLIGYVQDVTGRFTANQDELRRMLAGALTIPKHVALFEDWQVCHFRLRSTTRRSPYGVSVAEGARWIWKRLVMLEDAVMIYKLTRSPARYAFYVDVTDVPPNRVESFLKRAKRDLKKKKMVNPNNNFLDMRYNPLCLSGDTKIPLLNGTEKTLLEMVQAHERGEEQWVYSVDVKDGNKLVPGKVVWAGGTRKNAQLLKITLDNGESIKVTPDHKMIRRSGEFVEARELRSGDSLMPYYRKRGNVSPAAPDYEMVYDPSDRTYKFVHRVVAEALGIRTGAPDCVIHHEDCNRLNNDPRNLTEMTWAEHKELHHRLSRVAAEKLTAYNKSPEKRAKTAQQNHDYNKPALMRQSITPEIRERQKTAARESKTAFWADREKAAQAAAKMRYIYSTEFVEAVRKLVEAHPTAGAPAIARLANEAGLVRLLQEANPEKAGKIKNIHRDMLRWMCHDLGFANFEEFKILVPVDNHKVVKIEVMEEREDTYTLTVDTAHTFAVSAGVFVKNSNDEDFFIAVRDGRALSRVEVLSGPDYQNVDDVQYFQRKLHGALMVPRAYMGQDAPIQGRAILSNEDVRAARVSLQIQKELRNGIERLIRTDLAARRHPNPWAIELDVNMTVPSNIYELAAMEVKNARADFAARIQPYVSMRWLLENVFKLSDAEIREIEKQRQREADLADSMGMDPSFSPFTGGRPPAPGEAPPGGAGPGLEEVPGASGPGLEEIPGGGLEEVPGAGLEEVPGSGLEEVRPRRNAPAQEWRAYDRRRRLEERRYNESRRNQQQLLDKIEDLRTNDEIFSRRLMETTSFLREFKEAALKNSNGRLTSVPSAGGLRPSARSF